jgi:hypothetical protein
MAFDLRVFWRRVIESCCKSVREIYGQVEVILAFTIRDVAGRLASYGSLHDAYAIICIKALLITRPSDDHQRQRLYLAQVPWVQSQIRPLLWLFASSNS